VKLPKDWIQELYLKEIMHKSIKGEKTHGKYRQNAKQTEKNTERNRGISGQMQPPASTN
tara:strand:- start:1005 stop:1181 length:177 start_codon:yes stop_codon:yes gene_type:complete